MNFERVRLVTRRARLNMTQEALAQAAGVSVRSIAAWEAGTQMPTLRMMNRLADALSVPVGWLLGESPETLVTAPLKDDAKPFRSRADRIIARISELSESEFGRLEPVFLGIIDALLAGRGIGHRINSGARDPMEALSDEMVREDMVAVRGARGPNAPLRATTHARPMPGTTGGAPPTRDDRPPPANPH